MPQPKFQKGDIVRVDPRLTKKMWKRYENDERGVIVGVLPQKSIDFFKGQDLVVIRVRQAKDTFTYKLKQTKKNGADFLVKGWFCEIHILPKLPTLLKSIVTINPHKSTL